MQQARKIAVFRPLGEDLGDTLRRLSPQPEVLILDSLYEAAAEILEFRPTVAILAGGSIVEADLGSLRLLRAALGDLSYILVTAASREVELTSMARRLGAHLLLEPIDLRQLSSLVQDPRMAAEPSNPDYFLDLTRGLCDAINNPLMFASGHLQLLQTRQPWDAGEEQILAIQQALQEIGDCVEKIRALGEQGRARKVLLLSSLLEEVLADMDAEIEIDAPAGLKREAIWGNRDQLALAFRELLAMAMELGERHSLRLRRQDQTLQVELRLCGEFTKGWQLPRSFEPYYLARILRGSKHGLALFLVQAIVHAHGGTATAQKPDPQSLALVLSLPRA